MLITGSKDPSRNRSSNHHYRKGQAKDNPKQHLEVRAVDRSAAMIFRVRRQLEVFREPYRESGESNEEANDADHVQNVVMPGRAGVLSQRVAETQVHAPG